VDLHRSVHLSSGNLVKADEEKPPFTEVKLFLESGTSRAGQAVLVRS
jgi:hypothetical protein